MRVEAVHEATPQLLAALARLLPQLNPKLRVPDLERLQRLIADPAATLLVATEGDEIVGTTTVIVYTTPSGSRPGWTRWWSTTRPEARASARRWSKRRSRSAASVGRRWPSSSQGAVRIARPPTAFTRGWDSRSGSPTSSGSCWSKRLQPIHHRRQRRKRRLDRLRRRHVDSGHAQALERIHRPGALQERQVGLHRLGVARRDPLDEMVGSRDARCVLVNVEVAVEVGVKL